LSSGNAANTFKVLTTHMTIAHSHISINGYPTPFADARYPGRVAQEFRRASAATVCRVLGGDVSLVAEIKTRHAAAYRSRTFDADLSNESDWRTYCGSEQYGRSACRAGDGHGRPASSLLHVLAGTAARASGSAEGHDCIECSEPDAGAGRSGRA
jgi:hypothetical protein